MDNHPTSADLAIQMSNIINLPVVARPLPPSVSPIAALAVGVQMLNGDADSFTCIAGGMVMYDKLKELGFEVVRRSLS